MADSTPKQFPKINEKRQIVRFQRGIAPFLTRYDVSRSVTKLTERAFGMTKTLKAQAATPPQPTTLNELLDEDQTAALFGIEKRTLRLWRNKRSLPHLRITGKIIRYRLSDIAAWLDRTRVVIS